MGEEWGVGVSGKVGCESRWWEGTAGFLSVDHFLHKFSPFCQTNKQTNKQKIPKVSVGSFIFYFCHFYSNDIEFFYECGYA